MLQLNSRKIHDEPNVLEGLSQQKLFLIILALELGLQVGANILTDSLGSWVIWRNPVLVT